MDAGTSNAQPMTSHVSTLRNTWHAGWVPDRIWASLWNLEGINAELPRWTGDAGPGTAIVAQLQVCFAGLRRLHSVGPCMWQPGGLVMGKTEEKELDGCG